MKTPPEAGGKRILHFPCYDNIINISFSGSPTELLSGGNVMKENVLKVFTALQQPYVYLLNLLAPYVKRISEKWRDVIVEVAVSMILFIAFYEEIFALSPVPHSGTLRPIVSCLFFLVAVVFSLKDEVKPIRLNHAPITFFTLYVAALSVAFILKRIQPATASRAEILSWFTIYAILLPMLFIIWTNRGDLNRLYQKLTRPYAIIFTIYCWAMLFIGDWAEVNGELRMGGTTAHPNCFAALLFTGFVCCIYHLVTEEFSIFSGIYGLGFCLGSFNFRLTGSRTTMLAVLGAILVLLVYILMKKNRKALISLTAACAAAALAFCLAEPYYDREIRQVFSNEVVVSAGDTDEDTDAAKQQAVNEILDANEANRDSRVSLAGKGLNEILNGRPSIWSSYLKRLNFFGAHGRARLQDGKKYHEAMTWASHAHNYFIQMAFDYGAIAGSLSLLIAISAAVYIGFCVFDHSPFEKYRVFSILAICEFCITAIPEYYGKPLYTVISLLYIFALVPVFCKQEPEPEEIKPAAEAAEEE